MTAAAEGKQPDAKAWGDEISDERKAKLEQRLHDWEESAKYDDQQGPFDRHWSGLQLTGEDVFWLAARVLEGTSGAPADVDEMQRLRDASRGFFWYHVFYLSELSLNAADLRQANLAGAYLGQANLSAADLREANLAGGRLDESNLSGANLREANLAGAYLRDANLSGADLRRANLSGAGLRGANLAEAYLGQTNLSGADLRDARLSVETSFAPAPGRTTLSTTTLLADVTWNDAPLARLAWEALPVLGDEALARKRSDDGGTKKDDATRQQEYAAAVRAYRLLAVTLRSQGLNEYADRYAYRAQVMQRTALRRRGQLLQWLGSLLLAGIAGYGYRPLRTLFWYLAVIGSFAFAYFQATHGALTFGLPPSQIQPLPWYEALVLSVSSFHGRGFFQAVQSLGDPVAILAAIEAVFGLFIEVSFIATFTQRYFGK